MVRAAVLERLRRDPGLAWVTTGVLLAIALYAPTLARGLIGYDDPWLVGDNFLVRDPSARSLHAIFLDTSPRVRFVLGSEYLPVRDLSVMFDHAVWGTWYGGHHLTSLALYAGAVAAWFAALARLGFSRAVLGLAIALWAVHPTHAESVAWLSERKGVCGLLFSGLAALAYARYRQGERAWLLALAALAAVAAVWSKALAAFAVASIAGLEWFAPAPRASGRRALLGLITIALASGLAFMPVARTAVAMSVVTSTATSTAPGGWAETVLGLHGFYLSLAAVVHPNAPSYPIMTDGPSWLDIALGAVGLVAALAALLVPARRWPGGALVRAGAAIWLAGWFPVSRLVLPLRANLVADRYLLFATLGLTLIVAWLIDRAPRGRGRTALAIVALLAASLRTLDAQASWVDERTLWATAVRSNPSDGPAWATYAGTLAGAGDLEAAREVIAAGRRHSSARELVYQEGMLALRLGDRAAAVARLREAAERGEYRAAANLAVLLHEQRADDEALRWARAASAQAPMYVHGHRIAGKIALETGHLDEALREFTACHELGPQDLSSRFNLALAYLALGRAAEARPHLQAALADPSLAATARGLLDGTITAPGQPAATGTPAPGQPAATETPAPGQPAATGTPAP